MLEAAADHALGSRILKLELGGEVGAGSHFGGSGTGALQPCAHGVIGQLRAVTDKCCVNLAVSGSTGGVYGEFDHVSDAVLILIERGDAL